ncbi:MAG: saccharopine dehydrogenase NADP-binding domain-containing protein [Anaerolineae bacterium]|nr:saccharopine dehydrogenase NADP-binding domain-containing protein [Anaerolineae bacterium]
MTPDSWMLYGAYGYTGALLAEEAVRRGHHPLLAGRDEAQLRPLAARLGLEYRALALDDTAALHAAVREVPLVLHAAGPYIHTGPPMLEACLNGSAHYLDITGEVAVLEQAFALDARAREREIAIIPGVGFDVVPTDCLALYVAGQVPEPTRLTLAIHALTQSSAGTTKGVVETLARSPQGLVRREGRLQPYPYGRGATTFRFHSGRRPAAPIPWGDLITAYHSTGIPNITTYMALAPGTLRLLRVAGRFAGALSAVLSIAPLRGLVLKGIERGVKGPDAITRRTARASVYARVENDRGAQAEAWLETPEAYRLTAETGIRAVEQTLSGQPRGALTPAQAFGADFVLSVPETVRVDALE